MADGRLRLFNIVIASDQRERGNPTNSGDVGLCGFASAVPRMPRNDAVFCVKASQRRTFLPLLNSLRLQIAESISQRNYRRLIVWQKAKALVVDIYRASSTPLTTLAVELNFLNSDVSADLLNQSSEVGKLLNGLIKSLKPKSAPGASLPSAICHLPSDYHV